MTHQPDLEQSNALQALVVALLGVMILGCVLAVATATDVDTRAIFQTGAIEPLLRAVAFTS
ncbi:hypothetical protein [Nereida sp. MMG025]|uniref:hypothetical protein n=1 Tax=Nereida sp. MMG025 TaxID=2909981 RepID=UPI001F32713A|nr:hypothetical protein [Nereida sp. MMG025]MCF6443815.1 hypothetical protein [Nereida sp. MMG025]